MFGLSSVSANQCRSVTKGFQTAALRGLWRNRGHPLLSPFLIADCLLALNVIQGLTLTDPVDRSQPPLLFSRLNASSWMKNFLDGLTSAFLDDRRFLTSNRGGVDDMKNKHGFDRYHASATTTFDR